MFFIEKENKIVLFNENKELLKTTLEFMPQYANLEIIETDRPIENFEFADTKVWQEEQAKKERERLDMLTLTSADVERAIYKSKGMDFEDVLEYLKNNPDIDMKALRIELKANNFYRGNPYINQVGAILGYSSDDLDYLFKNKQFKPEEDDA